MKFKKVVKGFLIGVGVFGLGVFGWYKLIWKPKQEEVK